MSFLRKKGTQLFLCILLVHLASIWIEWEQVRFVSKLLLVPFLIFWLLSHIKPPKQLKTVFFPILGLLGAFAGDYLLSLSGETYFLIGMLGFMTTHICNSIYFLRLQPLKIKNNQPLLIVGLLLIFICLVVIVPIKDQLGDFLLPIFCYMILISVMTLFATNLYQSAHKHNALYYFIPGALFFVLSDCILAINKFQLHQSIFHIPIMFTYGMAILLLTTGFVKSEISPQLL